MEFRRGCNGNCTTPRHIAPLPFADIGERAFVNRSTLDMRELLNSRKGARLVVPGLVAGMTICENRTAARHAFPQDAMPVADRRMTLDLQCQDSAEYASSLKGVGRDRLRDGGSVVAFGLCENHRRLYEQIDIELVQDAWAPSHTAKPATL